MFWLVCAMAAGYCGRGCSKILCLPGAQRASVESDCAGLHELHVHIFYSAWAISRAHGEMYGAAPGQKLAQHAPSMHAGATREASLQCTIPVTSERGVKGLIHTDEGRLQLMAMKGVAAPQLQKSRTALRLAA